MLYILTNGTYVLKKVYGRDAPHRSPWANPGLPANYHPSPSSTAQRPPLRLHRTPPAHLRRHPSPPLRVLPGLHPRTPLQTLHAPSLRPRQCKLGHTIPVRPAPQHAIRPRASRARSMWIWRLKRGFCAAWRGGEVREDEGLGLAVGGLECIDLARMWYTRVSSQCAFISE